MAEKAASTAPTSLASCRPDTVTSTKVPSKGRHRRMVSLFEHEVIESEEAFDAVGDVTTGKRGAADVFDVLVEPELRLAGFADKLRPPFLVANLVAVGFAIVHHLDLLHRSIGVQTEGVGDEFMFANDLIEKEPAAAFDLPDFLSGLRTRMPEALSMA